MYIEEIIKIQNEITEIITNIQLKTIKIYRTTENMSDLILKELTFSLDDLSKVFLSTDKIQVSYFRICKMLEDLTSYMENRMFDFYTEKIDEKLISKDITDIVKLCTSAENLIKKINEDNLYEDEIHFLYRYKFYLSTLSYFLVA